MALLWQAYCREKKTHMKSIHLQHKQYPLHCTNFLPIIYCASSVTTNVNNCNTTNYFLTEAKNKSSKVECVWYQQFCLHGKIFIRTCFSIAQAQIKLFFNTANKLSQMSRIHEIKFF